MKMTIRNLSKREKNGIVSRLEATVKKYGAEKTRIVFSHYFANMKERQKTLNQMKELEKELSMLKKKALK